MWATTDYETNWWATSLEEDVTLTKNLQDKQTSESANQGKYTEISTEYTEYLLLPVRSKGEIRTTSQQMKNLTATRLEWTHVLSKPATSLRCMFWLVSFNRDHNLSPTKSVSAETRPNLRHNGVRSQQANTTHFVLWFVRVFEDTDKQCCPANRDLASGNT